MSPDDSYRFAEQRGLVPAMWVTGNCIAELGSIRVVSDATSMTTTVQPTAVEFRSLPSQACWPERFALTLTLDRAGRVRVRTARRMPGGDAQLSGASGTLRGHSLHLVRAIRFQGMIVSYLSVYCLLYSTLK